MELSRASNYDYIALNAHIRAIYKDRYNCKEEENRLRARMARIKGRDIERQIESYKTSRGCGIVVKRTIDRIDNIKFNTCLCKIKHPLTHSLMQMSEMLSNGILPFNGSLMDQPAQVMELIDITLRAIEREKYEIRKEQANVRR